MTVILEPAAQWDDNRQAFLAALADLQETAVAVGLVLQQAVDSSDGWPYVLRAEIRPSGGWRVLASLDVGLSEHGAMLLRSFPGEARMFSRFRARDRTFYVRRFCSLIEAALRSGALSGRRPARPTGRELRQVARKGGTLLRFGARPLPGASHSTEIELAVHDLCDRAANASQHPADVGASPE
jgi:hypothetical protein